MSSQGHKKRILIALFAIPTILFIIIKFSPTYFLILLIAVNAIGTWEFLKMYKSSNTFVLIGVVFSVIILLLNCFYSHFALYYYSMYFIAISLFRLFVKKQPSMALQDIAPLTIGIMYIPTLIVFHWFLRLDGWQWIVYLYAVVWASDSFAYYIGKGYGKRKLYPEVSPKKTWAGAYGSLIGGAITSIVLGSLLLEKPITQLAIIGFAIGFTSILGDLIESMFKRDAGVKDSGAWLSEHGGILDKIDAMLLAGVLLYFSKKLL